MLVVLSAVLLLAGPAQAASSVPNAPYADTGLVQLSVLNVAAEAHLDPAVTPFHQEDETWQPEASDTDSATSTWEPTWEESNPTWEPTPGDGTGYVEQTPDWESASTDPTAPAGDGETWIEGEGESWDEPAVAGETAYNPVPVASDPNWRNIHWAQGPGQIQGAWKEIVVSISDQYMWAYEGGDLVTSSLVSTGTAEVPATVTPVGYHSIIAKYDKQTMEGTISGEYYRVEDVPYVMYFDDLGNALHGTYWHNNFGTPMSHGCVNLPMDIAAIVYEWAPYGTAVTIIS